MRSTDNIPPEQPRAQSDDLAEAIALYAEIQKMHRNAGGGLGFAANHALYETAGAQDYSDILPNPPQNTTAWRGALYRQLRNTAIAEDGDAADAAYAGHGRGAPE